MSDNAGQGDGMIHRARDVAAGFADIGLTHAEDLLRRMSPEGREQARREREAKARRQKRVLMRLVMAAIAALLAWVLLAAIIAPGAALAASTALLLALTMLVFLRADARAPGREALAQATRSSLAEEAVVWLAAQRRGMPPPALQLVGALSRRFEAMAPQLDRLDPHSPAATALHKLIAVELPALVDGWRTVPISARRVPHADGRTSDDHLINGLALIDAELARASEQLERGACDEIAVQGRYLELKYQRDDRFP